jgi:serralysin
MPQTTFTVDLTGTQETPPNASAASGAGVVVWDSDTSTAAYEFIVSGLDFGPALGLAPMTAITDDDVTAMHFHNGDRGVAAPVVFGQFNPAQDTDLQVLMNDDGSWTISGVWDVTDASNVPITDFCLRAELDAGRLGRAVVLERSYHAIPGRRDPRAAGRAGGTDAGCAANDGPNLAIGLTP